MIDEIKCKCGYEMYLDKGWIVCECVKCGSDIDVGIIHKNGITQGKREIAATWLKQYCKNEYCAFYKIYTGKCDCSDFKQCPAMQENDDNTK